MPFLPAYLLPGGVLGGAGVGPEADGHADEKRPAGEAGVADEADGVGAAALAEAQPVEEGPRAEQRHPVAVGTLTLPAHHPRLVAD